MWPAILIVGVGEKRKIPIPFPLFLVWPFIVIGWMVVGLLALIKKMEPARSPVLANQSAEFPSGGQSEIIQGGDTITLKTQSHIPLKLALTVFSKLHGLRIDIRSKDKHDVYILVL